MSINRDATLLPTVQLPPGWCVYVPATNPLNQANLPSDRSDPQSALPPSLPSSVSPPDLLQAVVPYDRLFATPVDNTAFPERYPQQHIQRNIYSDICSSAKAPLHSPMIPHYQQMSAASDDQKRSGVQYSHRRRSTSTHTPFIPPSASPQPQWIPPPPPPASSSAQSLPPILPFEAQTRRGSPFTVYHVCTVCRKPRSARFHRKHPFEDGKPLPINSICHHCKSSKDVIDEVTYTRGAESDITVRLREETSGEDHQQRPACSEPERRRSRTRTTTTIHIDKDATPSVEPSSASLPSRNIIYRYVDGTKNAVEAPASPLPPAMPGPPLSPRAVMAERQASLRQSSQILSSPIGRSSVATKASVSTTDVRRIAREEFKRYGEQLVPAPPVTVSVNQRPSVTPSEARRIAHDEVKRYRGAERLLEKHPHAFSHGTAVPVVKSPLPPLVVPLNAALAQRGSSDTTYATDGSTPQSSVRAHGSVTQKRAEAVTRTAAASSTIRAVHAVASERYSVTVESQTATIPSTNRTVPLHPKDTEHIIVERDDIKGWPEETHQHSYRDWEMIRDDPMDASYSRSRVWLAASTVEPSSSISQRPPNLGGLAHQQQPTARSRLEPYESLPPPPDYLPSSKRTTKDTRIEVASQPQSTTTGERFMLRDPLSTSHQRGDFSAQRKQRIHDDQTQAPNQFEWNEEDVELMSGALPTVTSQGSGRHEVTQKKAVPYLQYAARTAPWMHPQHLYGVSEQRTSSEIQISQLPSDSSSRYSGAQTSDRRSYAVADKCSARPDGGSEYYPSSVPRTNQAPRDSVAMMRASRAPHHLDPSSHSRRTTHDISRQKTQRLRPSPPRSEDIVSDRRAIYRERSSSSEHIITERLVRTWRRSPDRQSRTGRSDFTSKPPRNADDRGRVPQRSSEPPSRPKGILRSRSGSPRDHEDAYYMRQRVAFASHDDIATLPPPTSPESAPNISKGMGISRLLRRPRDKTFDGQGEDDGSSRGRSHYTEDGQETYIPESKRAITRAFSESPSRERGLSISQQHEESYSHGPYHAEVSPTASMEVLTDIDTSRVGGRLEDTSRLFRTSERETRRQRSQQQREGYTEPAEERGWTRYVNVKKYRDETGPWVEVNETVVLDEDERAG